MLDTLLSSSINLSIALSVTATLIGLVRYRKLPPSLRWLALLAGFDTTMELITSFLSKVLHVKNNLFLLPFVLIGEISLAALAYRQALQSATFNRVLPWLLGLFISYALLESAFQLSEGSYVMRLEITVDLIQLGLAGLYFRKLLDELQVERLQADPFFWLSVGLATHGLDELFISLSSNYLLEHFSNQLQQIVFLGVRNVFNILLYLAYCLALWMRPLKTNSLSS